VPVAGRHARAGHGMAKGAAVSADVLSADQLEYMRQLADLALSTQPREPQVGDAVDCAPGLSARVTGYDAETGEVCVAVYLPGYAATVECTVGWANDATALTPQAGKEGGT
jgi:hypothetical protein